MRTISCLAWVVGIMGLLTAEITVAADGPVADIGPAVDSLAPGVCYRPGAQDRMSLDGKWEFATDPDDQGRAGWFKAGTVLAGARPIEVPGCWEAQGVGDEDSMFRHKYVGRAWYRRRFAVPEAWNGHRVFLTMADVHRRARVWVNGHDLGERVGFLANFEFEVTEFVTAGEEAFVAIEVDSRRREDDPLLGCVDAFHEVGVVWGGIWGHVSVEARGPAWVDDLFIQPEYAPPGARFTGKVVGDLATGYRNVRVEIIDAEGRTVVDRSWGREDAVNDAGQPRCEGRYSKGEALVDVPSLFVHREGVAGRRLGNRRCDKDPIRGAQNRDSRAAHIPQRHEVDGARVWGRQHLCGDDRTAGTDKEFYRKRLRVAKSIWIQPCAAPHAFRERGIL